MAPGPFLIFDKSALQSFSVDESNWLDNFFGNVITPLFFAEMLADLEKEVGKGHTPEQVVGSLAIRTPDMGVTTCAHHRIILSGAVSGHDVPLMVIIPRTQDEGRSSNNSNDRRCSFSTQGPGAESGKDGFSIRISLAPRYSEADR